MAADPLPSISGRRYHRDPIEMIATTHAPETLTERAILRFWAPLAATWLMMSVEGPFIAAVIARLHDPEYNLAAFGVAFSFALLVE